VPNHPPRTNRNHLYFEGRKTRKEVVAICLTDAAEIVEGIKDAICHGFSTEACSLLDPLLANFALLGDISQDLLEENHKLTVEAKTHFRDNAEFCHGHAKRSREERTTAICQAAIDDVNEWMALSIEYLEP